MKINPLARNVSSKVFAGYAECDRLSSPESSNINLLETIPPGTSTITTDNRKIKKRTVLMKLIRRMIKNSNESVHGDGIMRMYSGVPEISIEHDDVGLFADPIAFGGNQIRKQLTVDSSPPHKNTYDDNDDERSHKNSCQNRYDNNEGEDDDVQLFPCKRTDEEELTVASTPPDNGQNDDLAAKESASRENKLLEEVPKNVERCTIYGVESPTCNEEFLTVEECLKDIQNLEMSTIPKQISMNIFDDDGNCISRKLFDEDSEVRRELTKNGAAFYKTPHRQRSVDQDISIVDKRTISRQFNGQVAPLSSEISTFGSDAEIPPASRTVKVDTRGKILNSGTDLGLSVFEMNGIWDAAKDVMNVLNLYGSHDKNAAQNSSSNDEHEFVRKVLRKYNLPDIAMDQIIQEVADKIKTSKEDLAGEDSTAKPLSNESMEFGTELKYKTPQKGPERRQTTVILPQNDEAHSEILNASPLPLNTHKDKSENENYIICLDDSDVFSFDSPDKAICTKAKRIDLDLFEPFNSFDSKDVVQDHAILSVFSNDSTEFVLFSPFEKTDNEEIACVHTSHSDSRAIGASCGEKQTTVVRSFDINVYGASRGEEESTVTKSFDSNADTPVRENIEYKVKDRGGSSPDRNAVEQEFPSPVWIQTCPVESPGYAESNEHRLEGRKLAFDSGDTREQIPVILSDATSLLLSLRDITHGTYNPNREQKRNRFDTIPKRDVNNILQTMKEECIHRLDHNIAKFSAANSQTVHGTSSSGSVHESEEYIEETCPTMAIRRENSELIQSNVQNDLMDITISQQSPLGIMEFPLDEVTDDLSQMLKVKTPQKPKSAIEIFPSPKLAIKRTDTNLKGILSFVEDKDGSVTTASKPNLKENESKCNKVGTLTISERIAQLQNHFKGVVLDT